MQFPRRLFFLILFLILQNFGVIANVCGVLLAAAGLVRCTSLHRGSLPPPRAGTSCWVTWSSRCCAGVNRTALVQAERVWWGQRRGSPCPQLTRCPGDVTRGSVVRLLLDDAAFFPSARCDALFRLRTMGWGSSGVKSVLCGCSIFEICFM